MFRLSGENWRRGWLSIMIVVALYVLVNLRQPLTGIHSLFLSTLIAVSLLLVSHFADSHKQSRKSRIIMQIVLFFLVLIYYVDAMFTGRFYHVHWSSIMLSPPTLIITIACLVVQIRALLIIIRLLKEPSQIHAGQTKK